MNRFLYTFVFLFLHKVTIAQDVQIQSFIGNDGFQLNSIIQKEITKNKKLNYFGFSNVFTEYQSTDSLDLDLLNLAHYNLYKGIVAIGGVSISKKDMIPQLGLGYTMDKDRFNLNIFPMLNYSLKEKEVGGGLYTLMEYTPHIKNKWDLYTMLILDTDFNFREHLESKQYIRIGTQFDKRLQFGLGIDLSQKTNDFIFSSHYGGFLGYSF